VTFIGKNSLSSSYLNATLSLLTDKVVTAIFVTIKSQSGFGFVNLL